MTVDDVDIQPNGISIERTLDVVSYILADTEFSMGVIEHNGWNKNLDQKDVAILFLSSRYQWSVDLLTRQTYTLRRELDGALLRLAEIEDRLSE